MKKHWIQDAIKKSGSLSAQANREGKSTAEYAKEDDKDPGKMGKRARLAETLMKLRNP